MEAVAYFLIGLPTSSRKKRGRIRVIQGLAVGPRHHAPRHAGAAPEERGGYVDIDMTESMTGRLCARRGEAPRHAQFNCLAIAPTATIANIIGVSASIGSRPSRISS